MQRWSFSQLKTYETCPARYKYAYIDLLPQPTGPAAERGKRVHAGIEQYLKGEADTLPDEAAAFASDFEEVRELGGLAEHEILLDRSWAHTDAEGRWLKAIIDVLLMYEDGTADLIDIKTGRRYPEHLQQVQLYATAVMSAYQHITSVTMRLWYLDSGEKICDTMLSAKLESVQRSWDRRAEKMFADTRYLPAPDRHCNWCPFSRSAGGPCSKG